MKSKSVVIIGAGGHAKVVIDTLTSAGYNVSAIYDDDPKKQGTRFLDIPIQGPINEAFIKSKGSEPAVIGIGDNLVRKKIAERLPGMKWATAVHPYSYVASSAIIGPGSVVFAGAILQPYCEIGSHCIINTGAMVDHDCLIGDFVHIAPGNRIAGNVTLGAGVFLGIGCSVIPGIKVGEWTVVGAGAAVVRDIPAKVTAIGVPARVTKSHDR